MKRILNSTLTLYAFLLTYLTMTLCLGSGLVLCIGPRGHFGLESEHKAKPLPTRHNHTDESNSSATDSIRAGNDHCHFSCVDYGIPSAANRNLTPVRDDFEISIFANLTPFPVITFSSHPYALYSNGERNEPDRQFPTFLLTTILLI